MIFSTGAVLTVPMFDFAASAFGGKDHRVMVCSGSGGTDICGGCKAYCYSSTLFR